MDCSTHLGILGASGCGIGSGHGAGSGPPTPDPMAGSMMYALGPTVTFKGQIQEPDQLPK